MILTTSRRRGLKILAVIVFSAAAAMHAADGPSADDVGLLKAQLAAQQKQVESLQKAIVEEQRLLERAIEAKPIHLAQPAGPAEATNTAPASPALPLTASGTSDGSANPCEQGYQENAVPTYLRLGNVCILPLGFMDLTSVWRDKATGSGIGTNFGSVPYNTSNPASKLSEFRLSPQNSRIGFRIDGKWKGAHFTGYNEFDFLSSATPGSAGVTNGAFVPRLRLFWVDVRRGKWEVLGGQSWSMIVPNRAGISALPSDLFYSQVIDANYVAGLPWDRQPGIRLLYHPNGKVTMGVSIEDPNQYSGGSAGGPGITLPAALSAVNGAQLDNTTGNFFTTPNLMPDIIGKVAFDPSSRVHLEAAGLVREFKIWNPAITTANVYSTTTGGGGALNGNFEIAKGLRVITNNFFGEGVGRYLLGQAPDVVVGADGSLKALASAGLVQGLEWTHSKWQWYGYFGDVYIDRDALLDANGKTPIGYGYAGSPNSQNRSIQEFTFGFSETLWRDARLGALTFMGQYEYMLRRPWFRAAGAPDAAHDNAIYFDFRYTLPGSMPRF